MVGVVQRLEHWTVAPGVGGSNPLAHPNNAPVAQWIEHQPPELGVGGSTPLWRARLFFCMISGKRFFLG